MQIPILNWIVVTHTCHQGECISPVQVWMVRCEIVYEAACSGWCCKCVCSAGQCLVCGWLNMDSLVAPDTSHTDRGYEKNCGSRNKPLSCAVLAQSCDSQSPRERVSNPQKKIMGLKPSELVRYSYHYATAPMAEEQHTSCTQQHCVEASAIDSLSLLSCSSGS